MSFDPESFTFGVDLITQAINQINFLGQVNKIPELKLPNIIARSVYRYEKFWLPLAAAYPQECFSAPLDIEWVWHCHMLSPRAYATDCQNIVNSVVNHTLKDKTDFQISQTKSRDIWYKLYGEEKEPFTVDFNASYDDHDMNNFMSKISYNIVEAASRQKEFYYQVSLPHYKDTKFLDGGLVRYKKFLYLKQQLPEEFIVPCYDIDLLWHTHQLNPRIYKQDMMKYIGNLFNHDDNVGSRSKGSKLYNADLNTREHWKTIFAERFSLYGAMYRGPPSETLFYQLSENDIESFITWKTNFHPVEMSLQCSEGRLLSKFKLNLHGNDGSKNDYRKCKLVCFRKPSKSVKCHSEIIWSRKELIKNGAFVLDTRHYSHIAFDIQKSFGIACCADYESIGEFSYNVKPEIENSKGAGRFDITAPLSSDLTLTMSGTYTPTRGPALLYLDEGQFQSVSVTDLTDRGSAPVSFQNIPPGGGNSCKVATHRMKNHVGSVVFTCRTIHSVQLMQSVVQVFYHGNKLAATGHLIASDQLPLPTQVKDDVISLNPRSGERAMLIKNNQGDWGIVVGKWVYFEVGRAGTPRWHGTQGSPGRLHVTFYKLAAENFQRKTTYVYDIDSYRENYTLQIESAQIDLMKGIVEIDPTSNEVAENLALAFSISVLHVLCVPRPSKWKEGQSVMEPAVKKRGPNKVKKIPSDEMKFITAAGLLVSSPSNFYIRSHHGMTACAMCGGGGQYSDIVADFSTESDDLKSYGISGAGMDHAKGEPGDGGGGCGGCGGGGGYSSVYTTYTPTRYHSYRSRGYYGGGGYGGGGGYDGGCDGGCGGGCGGGGCGGC